MKIRQVYQFEGVSVVVDDQEVANMFAAAPKRTFIGMRDYVGQVSGSFRRTWLEVAKAQVKGPRSDALLRTFKYKITPSQGQVPDKPDLSEISAKYETTSPILLGLEKGGTYGPKLGSRYLAIPLKGGPAFNSLGVKKKEYASPKVARASGGASTAFGTNAKAKTFFTFKSAAGKLFLAQLFSKGAGKNRKYWFQLVWHLQKSITVLPRLRFLATWEAMAPDRSRRLIDTKAKIMADIQNDVRR